MLKMREIGVANIIEDESVIQYIIDGIDDDHNNKMLLYGAKSSYKGLKLKLEYYERFKASATKKKVESGK